MEIEPIEVNEWVARLERLKYARDLVTKFKEAAGDKQARLFNRNKRHATFAVGDLVLRKTHFLSNAAQGINAKLCPKYEGPFEIEEVLSPTVYTLKSDGKSRRIAKVHISHLKRFVPPRG